MALISLLAAVEFISSTCTSVLGNRADAEVVKGWNKALEHLRRGKLPLNHDLARAVQRAFLMAQESICIEALPRTVTPHELFWIKRRLEQVREGMRRLRPGQGEEPPFEEVIALAQPNQPPREYWVAAALDDSDTLELFAGMVRDSLVPRMQAYFAVEIKYTPEVRAIFQTQLLAQVSGDAAIQRHLLEEMAAALRESAAHLPMVVQHLTVIDRQLAAVEVKLDDLLRVVQEGFRQLSDQLGPGTATRTAPAVTRVCRLPFPRNPHFTGRSTELEALAATLQMSGASDCIHVATITGVGGIGKTQLALEFAYRHFEEYRIIWWIRSTERASLLQDLLDLGEQLHLPDQPTTDQEKAVAAILNGLANLDRWLLIYDGAAHCDSLIGYLPKARSGHVLITSPYSNWRKVGSDPLRLHLLDRAESTRFIIGRTGLNDWDEASAVAGYMNDLPAALEEACAFIEQMGLSIAEFRRGYVDYRRNWLEMVDMEITRGPTLTETRLRHNISFWREYRFGEAPYNLAAIWVDLASLLVMREKRADAQRAWDEALRLYEQMLPTGHPRLENIRAWMTDHSSQA